MILSICSQCINKQYQDFWGQEGRLFTTQLIWQWLTNVINVLWCRFQKLFRTFTKSRIEESCETGLFRHLSDYVFGVRNFGNAKSVSVIFFSKCLKLNLDLEKASRNWKKVFCFSDNCIWTGIVKLSLLRTGYISSAANVLTSRLKILHVNKRDFFQLNWLGRDQWIR